MNYCCYTYGHIIIGKKIENLSQINDFKILHIVIILGQKFSWQIYKYEVVIQSVKKKRKLLLKKKDVAVNI